MIKRDIQIGYAANAGVLMHARPLQVLVNKISPLKSKILVYKNHNTKEIADAKSIMGLLGLCISDGTLLTFIIKGEDEQIAKKIIEEVFWEINQKAQ